MISDLSLRLLEFDKLLAMIAQTARSAATADMVMAIRPGTDRHEIEQAQELVGDVRRLRAEERGLGLEPFEDISAAVRKALPDGAVLEGTDLARFIPVLTMTSGLAKRAPEFERLHALSALVMPLTGYPDLLDVLRRTVDAEGTILDSASAALASLRSAIRKSEAVIQKRLAEMVRDTGVETFLQDTFVTKRGGRWVIPVRMDSKGQVPGVVHDVSKSGETAFVEPLEIIHLANELENLVAEAKSEEIRILRSLTARVREHADGIAAECGTLVRVDATDCIAGLADRLDMAAPSVNDAGAIAISRGRHPLLHAAFTKEGSGKTVVPLGVSLGGDTTVMVITGSNAGGKTVAIKTIGLILCMGLAGMPVPAEPSSTLPLVEDLLIDMGDEQSIETNLSTFSAHVMNISRIVQNAGRGTVVLIDELGTGTDPDEGAAISCAVLRELQSLGSLVFATTHLTGIKGFVQTSPGMVNASMEFDRRTLSPMYRLRVGEYGHSHGLEIAEKYGLPARLISAARGMISGVKLEFERLLGEADEKRRTYERMTAELQQRLDEVEKREEDVRRKLDEAEASRRETVEKAYHEALAIVADAKRAMNRQLDSLKQADRQQHRQAVRDAERTAADLSAKAAALSASSAALDASSLKAGDVIHVRSLGYDAEVVDLLPQTGRLRVRAGAVEIEIPASEAMPRSGRVFLQSSGRTGGRASTDEAAAMELNIVGKRVDEALSILEPFLNHASLAGLRQVVVIHGIGKGLLARAVREHLTGHPLVARFRGGERGEGGAGVTVATLSEEAGHSGRGG